MNAAHRFNGLNGSVATREELQEIIDLAKSQEQLFVSNKLYRLLENNPEETKFKISLIERAIDKAPESILHCFDCETEFTNEELDGLGRIDPNDIYQMMTDKMIEAIKSATGRGYKKKWKNGYATDADGNPLKGYLIPFNFVSKKPYRGINQWLLSNIEDLVVMPLENPFYLTFKQIEKLGGKLKKGSRGREVVYFTILYKIKTDTLDFASYDEKKFIDYLKKNGFDESQIKKTVFNSKIPILKYYNVFNGSDVEGIDFDLENFKIGYVAPEQKGVKQERIELAELIKANYPQPQPKYKEGNSDKAYYSPSADRVTMPHFDNFETAQDFYRTLFHEFTHSTGNTKRLARDFSGRFGSKPYAKEELVAEFGAVFLSAHAGIIWHSNINHAEYMRNWHNVLGIIEEDNRFLMRAASDAQKAADFVLNLDSEGIPEYLKEVGKAVDASPKEPETTSVVPRIRFEKQGYKWAVLEVYESGTGKNYRYYFKKIADFKTRKEAIAFMESYEASKSAEVKPKTTVLPGAAPKSKIDVVDYPLNKINLSHSRFQNRAKLNETTVNSIVENFTETQFDPVILWTDPKDKKVYLLAGHHRLEAFRKMGKKSIPAKFADKDYPTEKEAITYARRLSNANRTLETPLERAKIYREMMLSGESKKAIDDAAKIEGRNKNYILNLAALRDTGLVVEALERFIDAPDKQTEKELEKIADWIGETRRRYSVISDSHETEMFKFLNDSNASKRIRSKSDFLQKINSIVGTAFFDENSPLNLNRIKYESEGEKLYNKEYQEIQTAISDVQDSISDIKARFYDVSHPNFIKPEAQDYDKVKSNADNKISQLNQEIKQFQRKLLELSKDKSKMVSAGQNQGALFSPKKTTTKPKPNSLIMNMSEKPNKDVEYFNISGDFGKFIGKVERKPVDSVAITLDAPQGAGKTRFFFYAMNEMAKSGYRCLFVSLEEHPLSDLFQQKKNKYIDKKNQNNIDVVGELPNGYQDLKNIIDQYDCIFIDSWGKLAELENIDFDRDLRKKFNSKLFFVIFQRTVTGTMRGGARSQFDGDIIMKIEKDDTGNFKNNFAFHDKNRYQSIELDKLKFNLYTHRLIKPKPEVKPTKTKNNE